MISNHISPEGVNDKEKTPYVFGIIGLGTMGRNLLLNMGDHGYAVAGYDKDPEKVSLLEEEGKGMKAKAFLSLEGFINSLQSPRTVMLLVPAGKVVDLVIQEVLPLLAQGDIVIDGGNSHFKDTDRRVETLKSVGCHFFGMGVSGGEEGARHGPSMMPGGDKEAYKVVKPVLEAIAANVDGEPCVAYIGPGSSGHFVKMVHNGIEYALMQLIADTYEMLKKGLGAEDSSIHQIFKQWNAGRLKSYLLEITTDILTFKEPHADHLLLDDIQDVAKAKGTGKWTSQVAMDLTLPVPIIDAAVSMRDLSKYKSLRITMSSLYTDPQLKETDGIDSLKLIAALEEAFFSGMVMAYAQGLHLLSMASKTYGFDLNLAEIAKIWRGGCIIRAGFLDTVYDAFHRNPELEHLLLDETVRSQLVVAIPDLRRVLTSAIDRGISLPTYASAISYFDSLRNQRLPANLIQAQRDYFGAHTYERMDKEGVFHTHWER